MKDHRDATFFESPADLCRWLEKHHATEGELWVGAYRKSTGRPSVTWEQIVDELLCFGWIDGQRRSLDDERWVIRVTPRRPGSNWSAVNVRRVPELMAEGRMTAAGEAAFEARDPKKTPYSYETAHMMLAPDYEGRLRANEAAWHWFQQQSASYRRLTTHWVMTAKREETRVRRLSTLIEDSAHERKVKPLTPPGQADRRKRSEQTERP